jgi:hypothetical protein
MGAKANATASLLAFTTLRLTNLTGAPKLNTMVSGLFISMALSDGVDEVNDVWASTDALVNVIVISSIATYFFILFPLFQLGDSLLKIFF